MAKNTRVRAKSQSILDHCVAAVNQFGPAVGRWLNHMRIVGPIYVTSAGLAAAYGWGWLATYGWIFGGALAAFACTCEFILPVIGERIEAARRGGKIFGLACAGAIALGFGTLSGVVAYNAAEAPTAAFDAGQDAIRRAEADVLAARVVLAGFNCTPDMPAERCERNKAMNVEAEGRASRDLAGAEAALVLVRASAAPAPAVHVPDVPWIVKLGMGLAIDFVLIIFPWAARIERRDEAVAPVAVPLTEVAPPTVAPVLVAAVKVNDGGWATRREKYGPSGLKRRRIRGVVAGGKA